MAEYKEDKTGILEEIFTEVRNKYFEEFNCLRFQYIWRKKPKLSREGLNIVGSVFRMSPKMRDLHGFDIQIEIHKDSFPKDKKGRRKLAFHELKHIELKRDEDGEISVDKQGRIKYNLVPHDISILRFKDELDKFGVDDCEAKWIKELMYLYKKSEDKKSEDKRSNK